MFSIIRPGMKMADVDRLAREYNFEQLKAIGAEDILVLSLEKMIR